MYGCSYVRGDFETLPFYPLQFEIADQIHATIEDSVRFIP